MLDDLLLVVNQTFLTTPLIPRRICILHPYYLKTYHLPLILRPPLRNLPIYAAKYVQILNINLICAPFLTCARGRPPSPALPLLRL